MLYGQELQRAITKMGLSKRQFAAKCIRPDGKPLSQQAIGDLIRKSDVDSEDDTIKAVEAALKKHCRTCGHYTEDENAWDNQSTDRGKGGRQRQG